MGIDTTHRTTEAEIMDDFTLKGEELRDALDKIADINRLLGGNTLTLQGVKQLLAKADAKPTITIADVGCGNGDMLRMLADYGCNNNINLRLIGIDANRYTVDYAKLLSAGYETITYQCIDIFKEEFKALQYDIVLCTLTLHHFDNEHILKILRVFYNYAAIGVVINDLHRSKLSYRLFGVLCRLFSLNSMSREDGLISILRGFKKEELQQYAEELGIEKQSSIQWKWAFRYQWIISKI